MSLTKIVILVPDILGCCYNGSVRTQSNNDFFTGDKGFLVVNLLPKIHTPLPGIAAVAQFAKTNGGFGLFTVRQELFGGIVLGL